MRLLTPFSAAKKQPAKGKRGKATPARRHRPVPAWRGPLLRFGAAAVVIVGAGTAIGWTVQSGSFARAWANVTDGALQLTADAGLAIDDVLVSGRENTKPGALLEQVGVQRGTPILSVDLEATRERVLALPWVKDARVERRLPDTLHVTLVERRPIALWQRGRDFTLVDQDGVAIAGQDVRKFHDLPIVIGEEAPKRAAGALAMLSSEPELLQRVRALTWVSGRRWTVRLNNGMDVELPEVDPAGAWTHLASLAREHGVLERDVVTIDLRIPDQLIMRVTPAARERAASPGANT
ncbi:FtsQ-type POTRA domain-containing protein [Thalassobaculum sp. OXR-137]|uniref:cell division protein FtsQ/DivIB n=1 Tax=Thalassobaculum sp. OXR-137 TaxID=3100173 RepID=UPI002AC8BDD9|nr:FtsQ-type POTRA domain-containing protein [Thalassobaculum sp. OXR-137]WPZ32155.1 FtsQ-type POTRA domain-containing protein [Thalassobaculum sp. OXR-137]